ncbi:MAG: NAD(P)H-binding protein [Solirubrobacteraceae bacterium]
MGEIVNVLVTGITGYLGSVLAPALVHNGHAVRGFARHPERTAIEVPIIQGDAITGAGLAAALEGIEVAYYLIHSMEPSIGGPFSSRERVAAERFAQAAVAARVRRIVYLGGLLPQAGARSDHLSSRLDVEEILLAARPESVALRASIVIGAGSRSFRFLVRLVERLPIVAVPSWQVNRTQPIDERDMVALLVAAASTDAAAGQSLDIGGPDVVTYRQLIERIRDLMLIGRPTVGFRRLAVTPIASRVAALIAGEDHELVGPLMESLATDLLPSDDRAATLLGVRRHSLDAAIEHSLAEWERREPLAAR